MLLRAPEKVKMRMAKPIALMQGQAGQTGQQLCSTHNASWNSSAGHNPEKCNNCIALLGVLNVLSHRTCSLLAVNQPALCSRADIMLDPCMHMQNAEALLWCSQARSSRRANSGGVAM